MKNFWQNKTRLRRFLSLRNKTMYVVGQIAEKKEVDISEVIENMIINSPEFKIKVGEIAQIFPDIKKD